MESSARSSRRVQWPGRRTSSSANVIQQYLKAGLVDEIKIHLAPMLLGAGIWLFDDVGPMTFERTRVVESPFTTHLWYRVVKP